MPEMLLICGLSGAGKTQIAKPYAKQFNYVYMNPDEYYAMLNGDECNHTNFFDVWHRFYQDLHDLEVEGMNVLVDANSLTVSQREQFLEWFPSFEHHLIWVDCTRDVRWANNRSRRRVVPDDSMRRQEKKAEPPIDAREPAGWITIHYVHNHSNEGYTIEVIR